VIDPAALLTAVTGAVVGVAGVAQANRGRRELLRQQQAATSVASSQLHLEETQQALAAQAAVISSLERQADRATSRAEQAEKRAQYAEIRARTAEEALAECHTQLEEQRERDT